MLLPGIYTSIRNLYRLVMMKIYNQVEKPGVTGRYYRMLSINQPVICKCKS